MQYLNQTNVPLSVAVYLATDHYDYVPNAISATSLLKPVRQHVLSKRVPVEDAAIDVTGLVKSRMGTSIHDGIEKAWSGDNHKQAMKALGYTDDIIERVVINPDPDNLPAKAIPVYMEQRLFREFAGHTISGKFDFIGNGRLEDFKSTSVFTWIHDTKRDDYQLQGSIYRWLDQGKRITEDVIAIQFFFTDFAQAKAKQDPKYPGRQVEQLTIPLLSLEDTEDFVRQKLYAIEKYRDAHEQDLPQCNEKELWRKPATFKYYKDGNPNAARSTKNFDNSAAAYEHMQTKGGGKGIVIEKPGEVIACRYCPAFTICSQKDAYIAEGSLTL